MSTIQSSSAPDGAAPGRKAASAPWGPPARDDMTHIQVATLAWGLAVMASLLIFTSKFI